MVPTNSLWWERSSRRKTCHVVNNLRNLWPRPLIRTQIPDVTRENRSLTTTATTTTRVLTLTTTYECGGCAGFKAGDSKEAARTRISQGNGGVNFQPYDRRRKLFTCWGAGLPGTAVCRAKILSVHWGKYFCTVSVRFTKGLTIAPL